MFLFNLDFFMYKFKHYGIVFLCFFVLSFLQGKFIESIFVLFCYAQLRHRYVKTFHHDSFNKCIKLSVCYMCIAAVAVLPINISILSSVLVAVGIGYYLYRKQVNIDGCGTKNIQELTYDEFEKLCEHKGLLDHEIKIADIAFRQGIKGEQFYKAIGYSAVHAKRLRKQIKDKLFKDDTFMIP